MDHVPQLEKRPTAQMEVLLLKLEILAITQMEQARRLSVKLPTTLTAPVRPKLEILAITQMEQVRRQLVRLLITQMVQVQRALDLQLIAQDLIARQICASLSFVIVPIASSLNGVKEFVSHPE